MPRCNANRAPDRPARLPARHPVALETGAVFVPRNDAQHDLAEAFDRIGPKKIPPEWFEFIEDSCWDKASHKLTFDNVPVTNKVAFRFTNRGSIQLSELQPGKTVRRAHAELKLQNLPFMLRPMGALAEQMIAREARKLLEAEAEVLGQWLAEGRS